MLTSAVMAGGFGVRLKVLREKAGLTQEALARLAGLSTSFVSKLEQRDVDPAWSTVRSLAKALNISCDTFAEEDGDEIPEEKPAPRKPKK